MKHIVIIGTGLAGYMLAKEFRKLNQTDQLTLITKDDGCFYSKPLLSTALTQGKQPDDLPVSTVDEMRRQLDAKIYVGAEVTVIDPLKKTLQYHDENGDLQSQSYDQLVLANGAGKVHVPLSGDAVDEVFSVNNLEDYRLFRKALSNKKRIAILGAGLVGCEFANDLLNTQHDITLITPDQYPLMSLVPESVGLSLKKVFQEKGVSWHLSCFANAVNRVNDAYQVTLSDGTVVEADLVFSAVGIRSDLQLAKTAGLSVNKGVSVNYQLQTSDPNIFAIGDCAEVAGTLKMYVAPILQCAKVLAKVLHGDNTASLNYPVMPVVIKTSNCPVAVVLPEAGQSGQWQDACSSEEGVKALCLDQEKKLLGFALSGSFVKERMQLVKQIGHKL